MGGKARKISDWTRTMSKLHVLPCLDSERMAKARRQELQIPGDVAAGLGHSAVKAALEGFYLTKAGQVIVWRDAVQTGQKSEPVDFSQPSIRELPNLI